MKRFFDSVAGMLLLTLAVLSAGCGGGGGSSPGGTGTTYTLAGTVVSGMSGLAAVTVNLSGGKTASTATDAAGNFSFNVPNGSYTVTLVKTNYTFTPSSRNVTINDADSTGNTFDANAVAGTYTLSGTVSLSTGGALSGVTISLSGDNTGEVITNASGGYSFTVANGSYTVLPSMAGYSFSPTSIAVTVNGADSTGNNITAASNNGFSISGTILNSNPTGTTDISVCAYDLAMQGDALCTTINYSGGAYTLTGLPAGDYRIHGSQDINGNGMMEVGETYGQYSSIVTVSDADVTSVDFAVTPVSRIFGIITNNNPLGGAVVVCAIDAAMLGNCAAADPGTGMYEILVSDGDYTVFAWQDVNANGQPDNGEPYGNYTTSPPTPAVVTVSGGNVAGIDITIQ